MTRATHRFGAFELDAENCELRREGALVKLAPQPFTILLTLVSRAGRLVTRDELREAVWGSDRFVDFNAGLNFCMAQVRTALQDEASQPLYIATVPRRGYRFVAPVETLDRAEAAAPAPAAPSAPRSRRPWLAAAAAAAVAAVAAALVMRAAPSRVRADSPSLEARTAYERGALGLDDAGPEELRTRVARFEAAVRADPTYARAYAALAQAKLLMADYRAEAPQAAYAHAKAAAARAIELDPALPEAHAVYAAAVLSFEWDWTAAGAHFAQALRGGDDARVLHWYSRYLAALGRRDEAMDAAAREARLDPRSARAQANLGLIAYYAGRNREAVAACEHAVALLPQFTPGRQCAMSAAAQAGDLSTAVRHGAALMEEAGSAAAAVTQFRQAAAREGFPGFWRERLRLLRGAGTAAECDPRALSLALVLARLGEREAALDWLERAAELHMDALIYARVHPALADLHGQPRYARVLERVGLPRT